MIQNVFWENISDVQFESKYLLTVPVDSFDTTLNTKSNASINSNDSQVIFEKCVNLKVLIDSFESKCLSTMNAITTVRVNSSDQTSVSEKISISASLKSGSLFDDTLLFLSWVIYIVLRFIKFKTSSVLPSFQGLEGAPKYIFKYILRIRSRKDVFLIVRIRQSWHFILQFVLLFKLLKFMLICIPSYQTSSIINLSHMLQLLELIVQLKLSPAILINEI